MNRATLDSFDALFLSVGQRLGHFSAREASDASEAAERLSRSGHPVPIETLASSLGLADEQGVEAITAAIGEAEFQCASCAATLAGKDLAKKRTVKCPRCGEAGVERAGRGVTKSPSVRISAKQGPGASDPVTSKDSLLTGKAFEELRRIKIPVEAEAKPEAGDPLLGKVFGRYRVKGLLGVGGWGNVYLAESEGREFAIKVLRLELGKSADHLDRFMTEARITASLEHGVIRRTVDIGKHHGYHYMAMEYVDGASLHAIVAANGPLPSALASQVAVRIAEALQFAVRRGVVHRDIKPRNVLLSRSGEVKLTDFGLAKMMLEGSSLTGTGAVLGTPEFMSPEQFDGARADQRSDIYSLGCTLFFTLTGHAPFEGSDFSTLMRSHKSGQPPSPLRFNPEVPSSICSVLSRMLEKSASRRFQDYDGIIEELSEPGEKGASPTKMGRKEAEGLEEAWMDEERVKRCAEVQAVFSAEGMAPPPRWHVLRGLGYASGEEKEKDDGFFAQPIVLRCDGCGKSFKFKAPLRGELACPSCRGVAMSHAHFAVDRHACYLVLRIGDKGSSSAAGRDDLVRLAGLASQFGAHNVVLDFSACATFPSEMIGPLLRLREVLTADRVAPVLLASPKGVKGIKARGLHEFFLSFSSEKEVVEHIDAASLCPHARFFLCAVRGQLADPEEKVTENLGRSVHSCIDRAAFDEFYPVVRDALRKNDARQARSACATLGRRLQKIPCLQAAAKKVRDLAEDAIRLSLEHTAQGHLARGRTDRARVAAKEALASFPDSPVAADVLAQIALQEGRPSEAAGHFEAAARGAPSPGEYRLSEAAALQRAGDTAGALKCLDGVLEEDPSHFRAAHFKGTLHFSRGEYEEAKAAFDRALEIQPESADVLLWRGRAHHRLNRLTDSLRDFVRANRIEPRRPRTLANCGAICARLERHKEAVAFLKSAIHLNPSLSGPRYNLACSLAATGELDQALAALRDAVASGWNNRELAGRDPLLKPLRDDARLGQQFQAVLADMPVQGETEEY
jgi:tetratricopeptide (TPR) repeat protein/predicted Ser/Thr protein kinase/DNA-directed RNA polymerase subunit RPC12/RpoP